LLEKDFGLYSEVLSRDSKLLRVLFLRTAELAAQENMSKLEAFHFRAHYYFVHFRNLCLRAADNKTGQKNIKGYFELLQSDSAMCSMFGDVAIEKSDEYGAFQKTCRRARNKAPDLLADLNRLNRFA